MVGIPEGLLVLACACYLGGDLQPSLQPIDATRQRQYMATTRAKLRLPEDEEDGNMETGSDRDASTLSFDVSRCGSCSIDGRE